MTDGNVRAPSEQGSLPRARRISSRSSIGSSSSSEMDASSRRSSARELKRQRKQKEKLNKFMDKLKTLGTEPPGEPQHIQSSSKELPNPTMFASAAEQASPKRHSSLNMARDGNRGSSRHSSMPMASPFVVSQEEKTRIPSLVKSSRFRSQSMALGSFTEESEKTAAPYSEKKSASQNQDKLVDGVVSKFKSLATRPFQRKCC